MDTQHKSNRAAFLALTANIIWGFSFMATRIAIGHTSPSILLSLRFIASFVIMLALLAAGIGRINLKGKPIGRFLLMGLCEPVMYFIAETNGIKYTTASFSGLMISLIPIGTVILSVFILKEPLSLKRMAWIIVSVAGVSIISVSQRSEGVISTRGILYLLIAIITASFYTILSRSISDVFTAFERTFIMMLMGCIAFTATAIAEMGKGFVPQMAAAACDIHVILPVLFLSVICSAVAFFCRNYAISYLDVNRVVVFANITPVVSVLAGVLFLGEPFSLIYILGIALILTGVYKVNRV